MRKFVFALVAILFAAGAAMAQDEIPPHLRGTLIQSRRLEVDAPFQVALNYGSANSQKYILTGHADGTLWHQPYAPAGLGNVLPDESLDVTKGPASLVVRYADGTEIGIRFYPLDDAVHPGAILPFDPLGLAPMDLFVPGTEMDNVLLDCPIQGIPNDASVQNITAYGEYIAYVVIQGRWYADSSASPATKSVSASAAAIDGPDGYRMVLQHHYQDANGAEYVPLSECIKDANGRVITDTGGGRRACATFQ